MPPMISSGFAELLPVLLSSIPAGVLAMTGNITEFLRSLSFGIVENSVTLGSALEFLSGILIRRIKWFAYRLVTPFLALFSPSFETESMPVPPVPVFVSDLSVRLFGSVFFLVGSLPLPPLPFFLLSINANSNLFSSCSSSRRLRSSSSLAFRSYSRTSLIALYSSI